MINNCPPPLAQWRTPAVAIGAQGNEPADFW